MYRWHILLDQLLIILQPFGGSGPFENLRKLYIVVSEKQMCLYAKVDGFAGTRPEATSDSWVPASVPHLAFPFHFTMTNASLKFTSPCLRCFSMFAIVSCSQTKVLENPLMYKRCSNSVDVYVS